jgi:hypothetical protein
MTPRIDATLKTQVFVGDIYTLALRVTDEDVNASYLGAGIYLDLYEGCGTLVYQFTPVTVQVSSVPFQVFLVAPPSATADWPAGKVLSGTVRIYRDAPAIGPLTIANVEVSVCRSGTAIT